MLVSYKVVWFSWMEVGFLVYCDNIDLSLAYFILAVVLFLEYKKINLKFLKLN